MEIFLIILTGLIIGSFLNAVIFRLENLKTLIFERSICPNCKHQLGIADLVPLLSFILLKRKCRYCGVLISWQYFLVELATPIIFILIFLKFGLGAPAITAMILACFLIIITVYDLRYKLILDRVSFPAIGLALLFSILIGRTAFEIIIGGLIGGGFFLLQLLLSKGRWIGGGDLRMGVLMGLLLGWPLVLVALFLAYILGATVGVILLAAKKAGKKTKLAFGPFLAIAALITLLYGQQILDWYINLPNAMAAAGDGASSNIQLIDANHNGYIDQITFSIANPNLETWRTQGTLPYGFSITQDGQELSVSQVNIFNQSSNPVQVVITLGESAILSTDGVVSHPVELSYAQSGAVGSGSNLNDGVDELLNPIGAGDSDAHDTEIDRMPPQMLSADFRDKDANGRVETFRTYWSEEVKMQGAGLGDWQIGKGSLNALFVSAINDTVPGTTLDVGVSANIDQTSSSVVPTIRYTGVRPVVSDQSNNAAAASNALNVADAAAPAMIAVRPGDLDGDGTEDFISLDFSEKALINGDSRSGDYLTISYGGSALQIDRNNFTSAADNIKFYFFKSAAPAGNLAAVYTLKYFRGKGAAIADIANNELADGYTRTSSVPGPLSAADVILSNLEASHTNPFDLKFNVVLSLDPSFKIKLKMPGFTFPSFISTACPGLMGFFNGATSGSILALSYSHYAQVDPGTYQCTISGVINPGLAGSYGPYLMELTDKDDVVLYYNAKIAGDTIITSTTVTPAPVVTEPVPTPTPAPTPEPIVTTPLTDPVCESYYRPLIQGDAITFKVSLPSGQLQTAIDFICYGISSETIALGAGERRAVIRDYFQTLYLDQIYLDDLARNALGEKPVHRNLAKEQALVGSVLFDFRKIYGHDPVFTITQQDIAWNTLMHRLRFKRDLTAERTGIARYISLFGKNPSTPLDWAAVRVLAYVKI